jgi:hypothetical protein
VGLRAGVFIRWSAPHESSKVGINGGLCKSGIFTQRPLGRDVEGAEQVQPVGRCLSHTGRHEVGGGEEGVGAGGVTLSAAPGYLS